MKKILFNSPSVVGKELEYIEDVIKERKISGNGKYTKQTQLWFEERYNFRKCLLTTSCTDALEMAAILINIQPGDEVILPSYTFVSTANAFIMRGAKLIFIDSSPYHPGLDEKLLEGLITDKTKAIVVVHYAGVACNMPYIMNLANEKNIYVIEDAAQAIDSFYVNQDGSRIPLGSFGHLAALSFHETKNLNSGEGGMLIINHEPFMKRAEVIWEKGTNRSSFFRGEVDKYGWVDIGSSFLPSELNAAFLYAQLEKITDIQSKRLELWNRYYENLIKKGVDKLVRLPFLPFYATNNAHMFYLVLDELSTRTRLIHLLKSHNILSVFHYISLSTSDFIKYQHPESYKICNFSDYYTDCLLRLPLYYEMTFEDVDRISDIICEFAKEK